MPSKNIVDFANQIKTYMRGAEVVPSKNVWKVRDDISSDTSANVTYTISRTNGLVDYIDIDGTANARSAFNITTRDMNFTLPAGQYRLENLPTGIAGINVQGWNGSSEVGIVTFNSGTKAMTITSEQASYPLRFEVVVLNGTAMNHVKLYPMITLASETDQTYMPYYVPLKDSKLDIASQQVLGAWNLLPNNQITQELYGITFTANDDKSVSLSGTMASNAPVIYGTCITNYKLPAGRYLLSGAPKGGSKSTYHSLVNIKHSDNTTTPNWDTGDGVWFDIVDGDTISVYAPRVDTGFRGQSTNGLVWHPQITKEPNQPYVPYVMTNRELMDRFEPDSETISIPVTSSENVDFVFKKIVDSIVFITANNTTQSTGISTSWTELANFIPSKFRPTQKRYFDMILNGANFTMQIDTNGTLKFKSSSSSAIYIQGTTVYNL